uniref:Uncharacterized protein n=1 Tax=Octopus bimaculoides TaxID=37653 RepID=A0A0L8FV25_OCTBM
MCYKVTYFFTWFYVAVPFDIGQVERKIQRYLILTNEVEECILFTRNWRGSRKYDSEKLHC